jgi:dTDP-4-amino-4,6-dideoxygalactose transaminase
MQIPLVDPRAQYHTIKHEVLPAIERVLEGMELFLGPELHKFEREFATFSGCAHGVGVSSGTDALTLALRVCGVGCGDEVITVANSFIATVEAICLVGATPVFVDVDAETYTMDWRRLPRAFSLRTRAIIPVHLYGHPVELGPILAFARKHRLYVIEDASQAHGALYDGKPVGSFGDIGCFSLHYSKNLGAYGEAGICVTNNDKYGKALRRLRDHDSRERYHYEALGAAWPGEVQAAVLRVKLPHVERWNARRQALAAVYTERLEGIVDTVPVVRSWASHVFYAFVIQLAERDRLRQALEREGIMTGVHYPVPIHLQPACAYLGYRRGALPVTEAAAERVLSLPMYAELTLEQVVAVVEAIKRSRVVEPRGRDV